jgi:hypothetical protein
MNDIYIYFETKLYFYRNIEVKNTLFISATLGEKIKNTSIYEFFIIN